MNIKKLTIILLTGITLSSCGSQLWFKPKSYSYLYNGQYTGIDSLLDINGYYISNQTWDTISNPDAPSLTQRILLFYENGIVAHLIVCVFSEDRKYTSDKPYPVYALGEVAYYQKSKFEEVSICRGSKYYKKIQWGVYHIVGDTVKTQIIYDNGLSNRPWVIDKWYLIKSKNELDVIFQKYADSNHPIDNYFGNSLFNFHPYENRIDYKSNPYLTKTWFWEKDAYKNRKK